MTSLLLHTSLPFQKMSSKLKQFPFNRLYQHRDSTEKENKGKEDISSQQNAVRS
jgi:hypothetical protein